MNALIHELANEKIELKILELMHAFENAKFDYACF